MEFSPDGRIFVAQQTGELRVIKNGTLLTKPFITLSVNSSGERGLLGIAFDPAFGTNNFIYLYYTLATAANNRISRFTASGDTMVPGSEVVVLDLDPLSSATNHNGGTIHFGIDGKLYVGVGENANGANAQNLDTYLGKILRINSNGSVPAGNPFTSGTAQKQRVWEYGMRNPWTLSIQPVTGKIFVNDVGQNAWEEINDCTTSGLNYGWPNAEGMSTNVNYTNPVYTYAHGTGISLGCAITGGTFFNPSTSNYPASYTGCYFFLDFCGNWIDILTPSGTTWTHSNFASNISGSPVGIVTGPDGNLYYLSRNNSAVYKIVYTAPPTCNIPTGLSTTNITNTSAQLNWSNVSADSFMVRYAVHGTASFTWKKIVGQPNVVSTSIAGLQPATQYDWWIRSLCNGTSGSNYQTTPATFTTLTTPVSCVTPYNLGASSITNTSANISWTIYVSADTFRIRYSVNGTANFIWKDVNGSGGSSTSLSGLFPNTTYQFQVASRCTGVSSAYSTSYVFTTVNMPVSCITPYGTSTSNITGTSAVVNWTNQVSADSFMVRYSINGTSNFAWKKISGSGGATNTQLTALALSTTYQWQVRSVCTGVQQTPYSSSAIFTTLAARYSGVEAENNVGNITVYPNPANQKATVKFNSSAAMQYHLILADELGRIVQTRDGSTSEGINLIEIDISNLAKGNYIVRIVSNDGAQQILLVVE